VGVRDGVPFSSYCVTLESVVFSGEDVGSVYISGKHRALELARAWVFATGAPLMHRGFDLLLAPVQLPTGWRHNGAEVISQNDWSLLQSAVSHQSDYRLLEQLPLAAALTAVDAFQVADVMIFDMMQRYFSAIDAVEDEAHLLWFAHAVEVAVALLDGSDKREKQRQLPVEVRNILRRPVDWLGAISNTRRQTRHGISKHRGAALRPHPDMQDEEVSDFRHDADVIVRFVASRAMKLPFVHTSNGISARIL